MRRVLVVGLLAVVGCGGVVSTERGNSNGGNVLQGSSGQGAGGAAPQTTPSTKPSMTPPSSGGTTPAGPSMPAGPGTPESPQCWRDSLPPEPQPIQLSEPDFDAACQAALATSATIGGEAGGGDDAQRLLIGRFQRCGQATLVATPHDAVEFGGNRRYRLLSQDQTTMVLEPNEAGYFYFLSSGQLNLGKHEAAFLDVLQGAQAFRVNGAIYARTPAAPDNGRSNAPSLSDGQCGLAGDWDVTPTDGSGSPFILSLDELGNFVVHAPGADVCADTARYGTYQLTPGLFELTSNVGLGACAWWFSAGYQTTFESCSRLRLSNVYDNCTGGRGYLNGASLLVRR